MYDETIGKITTASQNKVKLLKSGIGKYLISSAYAGFFVGLGILLIFTIGGIMTAAGSPATKILMGVSFAIALSLVIFAGSELFTGNNMVMTVGVLNKGVTVMDLVKIWIMSYIGNLLGALILGFLFAHSGLVNGPVAEFFQKTAIAKATAPGIELFIRGILCNVLVCLAVLMSFRTQDDTAKLLLIFMCLFAFITTGFEHSIANMTIYAVGLFSDAINGVGITQFVANLVPVTIGNIVGGAVVLGLGIFNLKSSKSKEA